MKSPHRFAAIAVVAAFVSTTAADAQVIRRGNTTMVYHPGPVMHVGAIGQPATMIHPGPAIVHHMNTPADNAAYRYYLVHHDLNDAQLRAHYGLGGYLDPYYYGNYFPYPYPYGGYTYPTPYANSYAGGYSIAPAAVPQPPPVPYAGGYSNPYPYGGYYPPIGGGYSAGATMLPDYYGGAADADNPYSSRPTSAVLPKVEGNNAVIVVKVPFAVADVSFEGQPTTQTGKTRVYTTPELAPGKTYTYTIQGNWTQDATPRTVTREVRVAAGQTVTVDLTKGE
jgi:uncharacterized protein (TIGR03000 family)